MRFINLREKPDIIQAMAKGRSGDGEVTVSLQSGDIQVKER